MAVLTKRNTGVACLGYVLIVGNVVFVIIALAVIGVSAWLLVDKIKCVHAVLGTNVVYAADAIVITVGIVMLVVSVLGIIAAAKKQQRVLIAYFSLMLILFFLASASIICIIIFKTSLTERVVYYMSSILKENYGVRLYEPWNLQVTKCWDKVQSEWMCCAVEEHSWGIYYRSNWYKIQTGTENYDRPLVPPSCCRKDQYGEYENLRKCQTHKDGPPTHRGGYPNNALYYRGCYQAAYDNLYDIGWYLIGVGIGFAVIHLVCTALAVSLFCLLRRKPSDESSFMMDFTMSKPPVTSPDSSFRSASNSRNRPADLSHQSTSSKNTFVDHYTYGGGYYT